MAIHEAGEHVAAFARTIADKLALIVEPSGETRTYAELDDRSTRIARLFRDRGLRTGDHLALLVDNEAAFFDVVWAAHRSGLLVTPINWHLAPAEAGYIVGDCDAAVFVAAAGLAHVVAAMDPADLATAANLLRVGGAPDGFELDGFELDGFELDGFEELDELLADIELGPVADEHEGSWMFYSSGTTGRPKGIVPTMPAAPLGAPSFLTMMLTAMFGFGADTVYLNPAPLYHTAPAGWTTGVQRIGGTTVVMERFDPVELLATIERHGVTDVQLVPTHMIRLLELPESERARYDLSSLRRVIHAAAPCPVDVKQRFLDWVGPIVHEYYSGSEGSGFCYIGPEDWLAHPGSVGRSMTGAIHIVGPDGDEVPVGDEGEVWFETNRSFEYHKDPDKTRSVWNDHGWSWLGDIGRVDEEGFLYLTDRASHMIISGGVNIYPRETEDVLIAHPAVDDVAVLGLPDPEMGERVAAFVQLADGAAVTDQELIGYCRDRLSSFKCPREVRFVAELPRLPTGKLLKRLLVP